MKNFCDSKGQAILLVLTVLSVVSVIGFTFLYMTQVQLRGVSSYIARLKCKYLAEAGINHAREIIKFDKETTALDSYDELWSTAFQGSDIDLDNDGSSESRWFYVNDDEGNEIGRYAVLVKDESGKVNVNSAGRYNESGSIEGYNTFEISLKKLFENLNLGGQSLADSIIDYRYGNDGKPGIAGKDDNNNNSSLESDLADNDADGIVDEANEGIDEPYEFNIDNPVGDDQPFAVIEELKNIDEISSDTLEDINEFITVSSRDREVDNNGALRQNINYIKPDNLVKIMLDKGIVDCWQKAANIVDSLDTNQSRTAVYKHYNKLEAITGQATGDWDWVGNHFECGISGGRGIWTWMDLPYSDGEYSCFIYGLAGEFVGDVEIAGVTQKNMNSGEAFLMSETGKVTVQNGRLSLSIENNEEFGRTCYFKYAELMPESGSALLYKEFNGVEAVRINEIMVEPNFRINAPTSSGAGGFWVWQGSYFVNSHPDSGEEGEGSWIFQDIPNGYYYLKLLGKDGEFIGDVEINGTMQTSVRNGDNFTVVNTVRVSSNQLVVRIRNNLQDKTCYFRGIVLSQQPDAEYVELVNISSSAIDLSGWILETTGQEGVTAFVPQGTSIAAYDYLVLCVDNDDLAQGIHSNNISFKDTWAMQNAVQLDFFKVLDRDFDFLKDSPVEDENYLILKDAKGKIVDKVEYLDAQVVNYSALERGDPTDQSDSNLNSEFDGWYAAGDLSGGTPGKANNNGGTKKDEFVDHEIQEVGVRDYPITNMLDLNQVSNSSNWSKLGAYDISRILDSLTVSGAILYPMGNNVSGWTEIYGEREGFYSGTLGEGGVWQWQNLNNSDYFLTISGESDEAITVSYKKADDSWQILAQDIIPNEEGLVYCGAISIGGDNPIATQDNTLEIKLNNASITKIAHFYFLRLDPHNSIYGRININTAPKEVLLSLPNIDDQAASIIINNRPFGNKDGIYKGIGDLFLLSDIFKNDPERFNKTKSFSNLITVRSDVFGITARAQVLELGKVIATQEIKTIIERQ